MEYRSYLLTLIQNIRSCWIEWPAGYKIRDFWMLISGGFADCPEVLHHLAFTTGFLYREKEGIAGWLTWCHKALVSWAHIMGTIPKKASRQRGYYFLLDHVCAIVRLVPTACPICPRGPDLRIYFRKFHLLCPRTFILSH